MCFLNEMIVIAHSNARFELNVITYFHANAEWKTVEKYIVYNKYIRVTSHERHVVTSRRPFD